MPDIQPWTIRQAQPEDAAELIDYLKTILDGPDSNMPLTLDEFSRTVEAERDYLAELAASGNSLMLVAIVNGEIIGQLSLRGGQRRALRHAATLGISVRADWRGRGVGSALMAHALDWARAGGVLTRIELYVYTSNARAIHLYEKAGFEIEGRRRRVIYQDGVYVEDLIMGLLL